MQTTIKNIRKGFSNEMRMPYAVAEYECGHGGDVPMKPTILKCDHCGALREAYWRLSTNSATGWKHDGTDVHECQECHQGSRYSYHFTPDEHNAEHWLVSVGDNVECPRCDSRAAALEQARALDPATISHARYRDWCGTGRHYIYRRDPGSPSGVTLEMTVEADAAGDEVVRYLTGTSALERGLVKARKPSPGQMNLFGQRELPGTSARDAENAARDSAFHDDIPAGSPKTANEDSKAAFRAHMATEGLGRGY